MKKLGMDLGVNLNNQIGLAKKRALSVKNKKY